MSSKESNNENFMIGPVFESVIVGQCNEMKKNSLEVSYVWLIFLGIFLNLLLICADVTNF